MFRYKWGRLLSGGVLLTIIGLVLTINAAVNKPERYISLEGLSYKRLSDNMLIEGDITRLIGKYNYNFGNGRKTYFVAALPSTVNTNEIKYINISPESYERIEDPYLSDIRTKRWTESIENGTDLEEGTTGYIRCKLHKISEDDLTIAYNTCASYVSQGDILPYYAEPYYINYREQAASTPEYPIGVGIVVLVLGLGAVTVWVLRPVISKKDN